MKSEEEIKELIIKEQKDKVEEAIVSIIVGIVFCIIFAFMAINRVGGDWWWILYIFFAISGFFSTVSGIFNYIEESNKSYHDISIVKVYSLSEISEGVYDLENNILYYDNGFIFSPKWFARGLELRGEGHFKIHDIVSFDSIDGVSVEVSRTSAGIKKVRIGVFVKGCGESFFDIDRPSANDDLYFEHATDIAMFIHRMSINSKYSVYSIDESVSLDYGMGIQNIVRGLNIHLDESMSLGLRRGVSSKKDIEKIINAVKSSRAMKNGLIEK